MSSLADLQLEYMQSMCSSLDASPHLTAHEYNMEVMWLQDCIQTLDAEFDTIVAYFTEEETHDLRCKLESVKTWLQNHVVLV